MTNNHEGADDAPKDLAVDSAIRPSGAVARTIAPTGILKRMLPAVARTIAKGKTDE